MEENGGSEKKDKPWGQGVRYHATITKKLSLTRKNKKKLHGDEKKALERTNEWEIIKLRRG